MSDLIKNHNNQLKLIERPIQQLLMTLDGICATVAVQQRCMKEIIQLYLLLLP